MVFMQILLGGITRLTGSGLSITKWEIVTGTLPPMNFIQWEDAFDLYKESPQYQKINQGMTLQSFKYIYFWEYIHRLWARTIGLIFIFPFIYFLVKKWLDRGMIRKLIMACALGGIVAIFGWIMVASGLVNRPWVNAYKLTVHLGLGTLLLIYLWWLSIDYDTRIREICFKSKVPSRQASMFLIGLIMTQILVGGMMAGIKASLFYPTWPSIDGSWIPGEILLSENWNLARMSDYDKHPFMAALVQFVHRMLAYLIIVLVFMYIMRNWNKFRRNERIFTMIFSALLIIQVLLGIMTLIYSRGSVPFIFGVLHQAVGILMLLAAVLGLRLRLLY